MSVHPIDTPALARRIHHPGGASSSGTDIDDHGHLGVSYRTAWLVKHKLMAVMFEQERDRRFEGVVQVDDAFLGGERTGGKRGRGSENKVPLIAAAQTTGDGQAIYVRLDVLPDWKVPTVARWAVKALMPSTHVVGDGLASFVGVKSAACSHEPIIHNSGTAKANVQHARFMAINTLLGNLKMWMNTTFRGSKTGHYAMRYMAEFQYRFNRRFDLAKLAQGKDSCVKENSPSELRRQARMSNLIP